MGRHTGRGGERPQGAVAREGGGQDLPGEHGFRFFPGFYQNLPDTMSRIPAGTGTVRDNLVPASLEAIAYKGKELRVPVPGSIGGTLTPEAIRDYLRSAVTAVSTVPLRRSSSSSPNWSPS
ncbi:hypothetical protein AB0C28_39985 [Nonomuraea sp. NPDC048892]|uniref:hypothetical protein n=1 Tax=Nonomuraea sp. NPDC048892 TaxID=3154624 RepID=UPI0033DE121A